MASDFPQRKQLISPSVEDAAHLLRCEARRRTEDGLQFCVHARRPLSFQMFVSLFILCSTNHSCRLMHPALYFCTLLIVLQWLSCDSGTSEIEKHFLCDRLESTADQSCPAVYKSIYCKALSKRTKAPQFYQQSESRSNKRQRFQGDCKSIQICKFESSQCIFF